MESKNRYISFPKFKTEISNHLKKSKIYSLGSKKNTYKDEMRILKFINVEDVLKDFSDEEYDNILAKTLPHHEPVDPNVLELIKLLRKK